MKATILISCVAVAAILSGCVDDHQNSFTAVEYPADADTRTSLMRTAVSSIAGKEWVLADYEHNKLAAPLKNRATITFTPEEGEGIFRVTGRSFVNQYFGEFKIDEDTGDVTLTDGIGATKMAGSQESMNAEDFYFQQLGKVSFFTVNGDDQLVLFFGDKQEIGYFTKK